MIRHLHRRFVGAVAVLALVFVGTLVQVPLASVTNQSAEALAVRAMEPRYTGVVNGDFISVGNGVLQCNPNRPALTGSLDCNGLHSGAASLFNDRSWMGNVDVDSDAATFNSSRATLTVPSGARVARAELHWSGNTGVVNGVDGVRCGSNTVPTAHGYIGPVGTPGSSLPRLTVPGGSTVNVPVGSYTVEAENALPAGQPQYYAARQDVTASFANIPTGSAQTITVGNIWTPQGYGCYGGWSLTVVYDYGSYNPTVPASAARNVLIYDGHIRKFAADGAADSVTFSGFRAQGPGARAAFTLYEGDRAISGDTAQYTSTTNTTPIQLANAFGENGNIGVSVADGSVRFPNLPTTGTFVNASVDVISRTLTGVIAGATQVTLSLNTTGDSYLFQTAAFSVPSSAVRIDKAAANGTDTQTVTEGGTPRFRITVSNAGSTPLTNVQVQDPLAPACARTIGLLPVAPLPGASVTFECDGPPVSARGYTNVASVSGVPPTGESLSGTDSTEVRVAAIDISKTASPLVVPAGEPTTFTVVVTNTGDVPLSDVRVTDPVVPGCAGGPFTLAAGGTQTITCSATVRSALVNTANVTGSAGAGLTVTDTATARADSAGIRLTKATTGVVTDVDGDGTQSAGDTVQYTFQVVNSGSTPLTGVTVTDPKVGTVTCPSGVPVGGSVDCTPVTYALTQADIDAGQVVNTATATGTGGGLQVSAPSSVTTPLASSTAINLSKSAGAVRDAEGEPVPPEEVDAGDLLDYTFTVLNTGSTTLNGVSVEDPMLGGTITCAPTSIGPDATATCGPVPYELTQEDIDNAFVDNSASVSATGSTGVGVTDDDDLRVALGTEGGSVHIVKSHTAIRDVNGDGIGAGDEIDYQFTVSNTGNTTLVDLSVNDLLVDGLTCPQDTLAAGEEIICAGDPYVITQENIDSGWVQNVAEANAVDPQGVPVEDLSAQDISVIGQSRLVLTKTAGTPPTDPAVGDELTYTFQVQNTGTVTINDVAVIDEDLDVEVCEIASIAPGEIVECGPITHELTQAQIDSGRVVNTATASGSPANGTPPVIQDSATVVTPIERSSDIFVDKTADEIVDANDSGSVDAGDTIDYTVTVQNTGGTTLSDVTASDPLLGEDPLVCEPTTLAPGATATCGPVTYTLTQADLDLAWVLNTATGSATDPDGVVLTGEDSLTVPVEADSSIDLTKAAGDVVDANANGFLDAGDTVDYTFTITNGGARSLTEVALSDPLLGGAMTCDVPSPLAPGETVTCGPYTHTIGQGEIDDAGFTNTATVTALDPAQLTVEDAAEAEVPLQGASAVELTKTGTYVDVDADGVVDTSDRIDYRFTVRNAGQVTLDLGEIEDPMLEGDITCQTTELAPGLSVLCGPVAYPLTQADIDAGVVENEASVAGTPRDGSPVVSDTDTDAVELTRASAIELTKSAGEIVDANGTGLIDAGDTVEYTFEVENTGATTVTDIGIADPRIGIDALECGTGSLAPGDSVVCTAEYTLTVEDLTDGGVVNEATATAAGAGGAPDPAPATGEATLTIPQLSGIDLTKVAGPVVDADGVEVPDGEVAAGDRIVYTFSVTNTGTTRLAGLQITDTLLPELDLTCDPDPLDPGATAECGTGEYVLTQADVNAGLVVNDAEVTASVDAPGGAVVSDATSAPRGFNGTAALDLVKSIEGLEDTNDNGRVDAGDTMSYLFTVTNAGSETVTGIEVSDPLIGDEPIACDPTTLDPTESTTCGPVEYVLTQADIDAGQIGNTAIASGSDPGDEPVVSPEDTATLVFAELQTSLALTKTAGDIVDANDSGVVGDAGDTVDFTFTVENTGAVTVSEVTVADEMLEGSPFTCDPGSIAPGAESVCGPITYTLTQADVDAGVVVNTATATAASPGELPDPAPAEATETVEIEQAPGIALIKSAGEPVDANGSGRLDAGDTVEYAFEITNTGTTTLTEASITDALQAEGADPIGCALPEGGLAPGDGVVCSETFVYALTQADIDAGLVTNEATVDAVDVAGTAVSEVDSIDVALSVTPTIELDKSAGPLVDANDNGIVGDAGDTITYSFEVENTGASTLEEVAITDALQAEDAGPIVCDLPEGGLAPGESVVCEQEFTYTLVQADVDAGVVVNDATADGVDVSERPVSDEDSETVLVPQVPQLTVTKGAGPITRDGEPVEPGEAAAGDTVEYTISVQNTGTVSVRDLVVTDPLLSDDPLTCASSTVAPGAVVECEPVTYTLTQADVDAGQVLNTATAAGLFGPGEGQPVTDDGAHVLPVDAAPGVSLVKSWVGFEDVDGDGRLSAGDLATYSFAITNTGPTTLVEAAITDSKISDDPIACDLGEGLAPGASLDCEQATYELTQADIDAGVIENTATVDAVDAAGDPAVAEDSVTVPLPTQASMTLVKDAGAVEDANGTGRVDAGDTVDFTFTVTNTGAVSLSGVTVADELLEGSPFACEPGSIAPGAESDCGPITYTLTQADIDAGEVVNTATATATSPGDLPDPEPVEATETVEIEQAPGIALIKSAGEPVDANGSGRLDAGDTVDYSFEITNTGTTTLTEASITDALQAEGADPIGCALPEGGLAPGDGVACSETFVYALTQADIDAGEVLNDATVTAVDAAGAEVDDSDAVTVEFAAPGSLALTKTAGSLVDANDNAIIGDAGDTITYTFEVENTGAVTITEAAITDALQAEGADPIVCALPEGGLAPGESVVCEQEFTYTLVQADVDAGVVVNEAVVEGDQADGGTPTPGEDSETVLISQVPQLTVTKAAGPITRDGEPVEPGEAAAGDTVEYTISVQNTGTVSVRDLVVTDPLLGDGPLACASSTVAPGAVVECEPVTYTLTQADVDAGQVLNTATAAGLFGPGEGQPVSDEGSNTVPVDALPAVSLVKSIVGVEDVDGDGRISAGDVATYLFVITNDGATTLVEAAITDSKISDDLIACDLGEGLAPGASLDCEQATYELTQGDIDAGVIENTATVDAVDAAGDPAVAEDSVTVPLPTQASMTLVKDAGAVVDANGTGRVDAGDTVDFTFTVTNTGAVSLSGVTVADELLEGSPFACEPGSIAPGADAVCGPITYTLTQADIDAGEVVNTATATASSPEGLPDPEPVESTRTVELDAEPGIELTKSAGDVVDANGTGRVDAGDTITYGFIVTNSGATTLTEATITDALQAEDADPIVCALPTAGLAPGASVVCALTFTYTLTQADIDAGEVVNDATVTGTDTLGSEATGAAAVTVPLEVLPGLELVKTAGDILDEDGVPVAPGAAAAGDTVDYTITVTNTGASTVRDLVITDPLLSDHPLTCDTASLTPGAEALCGPVSYTLTQADIDAGQVLNTALAEGLTGPGAGQPVSDTGDHTLPVDSAPAVGLTKSVVEIQDTNESGVTDAGDTVVYGFTITNNGPTTLVEAEVTDPRLGDVTLVCDLGDGLAPGESLECATAEYALTQADIDAGEVANTATVDAVDTGGDPATGTDTVVQPLPSQSSLSLEKVGADPVDRNGNGRLDAGDTVDYTFTITNTGAVTVSGITVSDPMLPGSPFTCFPDAIAPGADAVCGPITYSLTQADIDAGEVINEASASGVTPPGQPDPVAVADTETIALEAEAGIALVKSAGPVVDANESGRVDAGDSVEFSFEVTNAGATTLTEVEVVDVLQEAGADPIGCVLPEGGLLPGESVECAATFVYELTQADIDAGEVLNAATATGVDTRGISVSDDDAVTVPVGALPGLVLTKSASEITRDGEPVEPGEAAAGDTVDYTITVENTGAVSVRDLVVTDALLSDGPLTCSADTLAPGETAECGPFTYPLTQADIDAGSVANTAAVTGVSGPGEGTPIGDEGTHLLPVDSIPTVGLVKSVLGIEDADGDGRPSAGDVVTYGFQVTNTGATTLADAVVTDAMLEGSPFACVLPEGGLAPGDVVDCAEGTYPLTQADVDAGVVENTATVDAVDVAGDEATAANSVLQPLPRVSEIALVKSAGEVVDANESGRVDVGDTVDYTFTVTNAGAVTLTDVTVTDEMLDGSPFTCVPGSIAPGEDAVCGPVTYPLTQADIDAGAVDNTATASASAPEGATDPEPVTDTETVELELEAAIGLVKDAGPVVDANGNGVVDAGDTIRYAFVVTNTGATTLTDAAIADVLQAPGEAPIDCALPTGGLAPTASVVCGETFLYTLTQADVDAGEVVNEATVTGIDTGGREATDSDTETVSVVALPGLSLVKEAGDVVDANGTGRVDAGDTVDYTFTVSNPGQLTLRDLVLTDPMLSDEALTCEIDALAPGEETTCGPVTYTLTQGDVDAGTVVNTASVEGLYGPGDGLPIADDATHTVSVDGAPAVGLIKTVLGIEDVDGDGRHSAGDLIGYGFVAVNSGATTLVSAEIVDTRISEEPIACDLGDGLAPGGLADCAQVTYEITQADIDAGGVENTATIEALDTAGAQAQGEDTVVQPLPSVVDLTLSKSAGEPVDANGTGRIDAGDTVAFTFAITNTGATTLTQVDITDALQPEGSAPISCALAAEGLAPGDTQLCAAPFVYTLTQADIDAGVVVNEALAEGTDAQGGVATDEDSVEVPVVAEAAIALVKSAGPVVDANESGRVDAGDSVEFSFEVTNAGATTLTEVEIADVLQESGADPIGCVLPEGGLVPGESVECAATFVYELTQADIDAGQVVNLATATGIDTLGAEVSDEDEVVVPIAAAPAVVLTKEAGDIVDANGNEVVDAGDTVDYTITVQNTGALTLTDLVVSDPLLSDEALTCSADTLAPGAELTCGPVTYTLTQGDVDAGSVLNTATVEGVAAGGTPVSDSGSHVLPVEAGPAVALVKSVLDIEDTNDSGLVDAGDTVVYGFEVTNTGATTLTEAVVTDAMLEGSPFACALPEGGLAPGDVADCVEGSYVLTQADLDAGVVENTATVDAVDGSGDGATAEDTAVQPLPQAAQLELIKSAGEVSDGAVDYTFTVTNTGAVTLTDVTVTDEMLDGSPFTCEPGSIAPGEDAVCGPVTYLLTQADLDAGEVVNTATATASAPEGATDPEPVSDTETIALDLESTIALVKSAGDVVDASGNGIVGDAGDMVDYTFTVTNTGPVTVTGVAVADPMLTGSPFVCEPDTLAPGADAVCGPVAYTITQADVDAAADLENTATATATAVGLTPDPEPAQDTEIVELAALPAVSLVKSAGPIVDANDSGVVDAGDEITYSFAVTNTGTTTLTEASITDVLQDAGAGPIGCALPEAGLAPGDTVGCDGTFTYVLAQSDMDAGVVVNEATVEAVDAADREVSDVDQVAVPVLQTPQVTLTKDAGEITRDGEPVEPGDAAAGDEVDYAISVQNTGTVTVTDLVVTDPMLSDEPLTCGPTTLAPGEVAECEPVTYTLTQADVDAGEVLNTATASGTGPGGTPVTDDGSHVLPVDGGPGVALVKSLLGIEDVDGDGLVSAGDLASYGFEITNTGRTTLTEASITDAKISDEPIACDLGEGLAPGDSVECSDASYTITQADVDAGVLTNAATVNAVDVESEPVSADDDAVNPIVQVAMLVLDKTASDVVDANGNGVVGDAGDVVDYTFTVSNTGSVTLTEVTVTDEMLAGSPFSCLPGEIAPGAQAVCGPVPYTLTQADVDAGEVVNTAVATATAPEGVEDPAPAEDTETVTLDTAPAVELVKSAGPVEDANGNGVTDAGDTITYSFVVTNTGPTTLVELVITDALQEEGADPIACTVPDGGLVPGDSVECEGTFTYTLTQSDVDADVVVNTATVDAVDVAGDPAADEDTLQVPVGALPGIELVKSAGEVQDANGNGVTDAGDTIDYTIAVTNTGQVTLRDLVVTDPMLADGPLDCTADTLAPGADLTCGPITHALTQADIDAGEVLNTAQVVGQYGPGDGFPITDEGSVLVPLEPGPGVALVKSVVEILDSNGTGLIDAGDTVVYGFTVTNTGTSTLVEAEVFDPMVLGDGSLTCDLGEGLAPGDSVECGTAEYLLDQADVDAGEVLNTATVEAVDVEGSPVGAEDSVVQPLPVTPEIELVKQAGEVVDANGNGIVGDAGDTVDYAFVVTNTGTVTLIEVMISDPMLDAEPFACGEGELAPGGSRICGPVTYTLTEADVDAGTVENTATVAGLAPGGQVVDDSDTVVVELAPVTPPNPTPTPTPTPTDPPTDPEPTPTPTDPPTTPVPPVDPPSPDRPSVSLTKSSSGVIDANGSRQVDLGDVIEYSFTVTNTGAVSLIAVVLEDPLLGGTLECSVGTLAPGGSAQCGPYTYAITQADLDAGEVLNTALVTASPAGGGAPVLDDDTVVTDTDGLPITGSDILVPVLVGVLLLLLGGGLILVTRNRREPGAEEADAGTA